MAYSKDGINWTQVNSPVFIADASAGYSYGFDCIAFGGDKFIAGGQIMVYSKDGIRWSKVTDNKLINTYDITYGNNKFIAVGQGANDKGSVAYSN